jgi:hypothetical protein
VRAASRIAARRRKRRPRAAHLENIALPAAIRLKA